jgi:argininosuccinate synthase
MKSREQLIAFAEEHQIPIAKDKRGDAPFSVDANLLHSSSEGKVLEDPWVEPPEYVHMRTISPDDAPDAVTEIAIDFEKGDAVAVDGVKMSPATLLTRLNELGRANGIGRLAHAALVAGEDFRFPNAVGVGGGAVEFFAGRRLLP